MISGPRHRRGEPQPRQRWRVSNRTDRSPRQQRRPGAEGPQEEDAARGRLPGNEGPHCLREAVRGQGSSEGRGHPQGAETSPQTRPARRPSPETGLHPDLEPNARLHDCPHDAGDHGGRDDNPDNSSAPAFEFLSRRTLTLNLGFIGPSRLLILIDRPELSGMAALPERQHLADLGRSACAHPVMQ